MRDKTPWLGVRRKAETRPVKSRNPTPKQVAETVLQELRDPGYLVSFFEGDIISTEEALRILAEAVMENRNAQT
jgi:ribosomal protein S19E (S16A)